ncbi:WD40 repeat-like protein [Zopfia rhizophila CBS 207.26]|uniref:WD40 repeat-like protein n=1 Tax=Zopfia rhizophila CBS 207.26 TaxID=1314779 RepID=A0A6A6DBV9_9PEZI|nr:WD40 repeat-like protein [Zopfia rhizophila CBS 207.26]
MSPSLYHECTRVPVTALTFCGQLLLAAEGPFVRFYHSQEFKLLTTKQIFIYHAIHGISVLSKNYHYDVVIIWGGPLLRVLKIHGSDLDYNIDILSLINFDSVLQLSPSITVSDWILYLSFGPVNSRAPPESKQAWICAAVTAHNALIELTVEHQNAATQEEDEAISRYRPLTIRVTELTASSRCILYSAHLVWDSHDHILIAAGTAFGEIIFWSWMRNPDTTTSSYIHQVFLGHEGSIFGVRISDEVQLSPHATSRRFLASCSDDRTIRVWDISNISKSRATAVALDENMDIQRERHTGFSDASFDPQASSPACLAIGWGHLSRVWAVYFIDSNSTSAGILMVSSGEDATSRVWRLTLNEPSETDDPKFTLQQVSSAAYHSNKNIWCLAICGLSSGHEQIICGAADSKITVYPVLNGMMGSFMKEFCVEDISSLRLSASTEPSSLSLAPKSHRSSKMAEFFRSYAFLDESSFLLTTNSGKVILKSRTAHSDLNTISAFSLIDHMDDLRGYSICVNIAPLGVVVLAGSRGSVYIYQKTTSKLSKLDTVQGKVGNMFATSYYDSAGKEILVLLVTLVGQRAAKLLFIDCPSHQPPFTPRKVVVPLSELLTGLVVTSMAYFSSPGNEDYILLGFRRGGVAVYKTPKDTEAAEDTDRTEYAPVVRILERVHGKETVTSVLWISHSIPTTGHLISAGRDGCITVHYMNLSTNSATLVHQLSLNVGSNIEGLYLHQSHLMVYSFSSTKFILYNTTTEEEVMKVDTGGAHRSWAFRLHQTGLGGTLVWTRASSMHIYNQTEPNHQVIRSGGHGREIKAIAISTRIRDGTAKQLIATGAEDTDLKIFRYENGETGAPNVVCLRTLRKHTTGIQHLQWSDDGSYLFSSGGCEEFYIWRVRSVPVIGIGVVCEAVYVPESEHSDLRITCFDVRGRRTSHGEPESGFVISMVFSNSNIKVYSYDPSAAVKWQRLAKGIYFTSCLTQCLFLSSSTIVTAGTDGHAVFWALGDIPKRPPAATSWTAETLRWKHPARLHQNTSKSLASHSISSRTILLVSGGDDGGLAFLLVSSSSSSPYSDDYPNLYPPIIIPRIHASAITACTVFAFRDKVFVLTSGNDQWIRLWEVIVHSSVKSTQEMYMGMGKGLLEGNKDPLEVKRLSKVKTNVADVSRMAVLENEGEVVKMLICGVGMEVLRIE